jgi:hypothetical protein
MENETQWSGLDEYAAAIPECCEYQGIDAHVNGLMLCWRLCAAIEAKRKMDCTGCDLATRTPYNA